MSDTSTIILEGVGSTTTVFCNTMFNTQVAFKVTYYKYLGVTVKVGLNGGFKSMGFIMVDANGVLGMVKYAARRSGSKYVVGREGWKGMVVNKLMYVCRALAWYQHECDDLEVKQNGMGR